MRRFFWLRIVFTFAFALNVLSASQPTYADQNWWNLAWHYRVSIPVPAGGYTRMDKPAEKNVDFTNLLLTLGASGSTLEVDSLRVVEVSNVQGDTILDAAVKFQFDEAASFDATTHALGSLVILMNGTTLTNTTRYYHLYFDTTAHGPFTPFSFTPQVTVTTVVNYADQDSFKAQTANATYYYHKRGAGFASMIDVEGKDWISYNLSNSPGAAGIFRGIPNMGVWAHPGFPEQGSGGSVGSTSVISTTTGPLKAVISSTSTDGFRSLTWAIYPTYATMALLSKPSGENYWFLYEGTPYGALDPDQDYYQLSNGTRMNVPVNESVTLSSDIVDPEWVFFGDSNTSRALFVAHHEDDDIQDYFRQQGDAMTVFGFGRKDPCCVSDFRLLTAVPAHFTIGFGETQATMTQTINSAYLNLGTITLGQPEALNQVFVYLPLILR